MTLATFELTIRYTTTIRGPALQQVDAAVRGTLPGHTGQNLSNLSGRARIQWRWVRHSQY